MVAALLYLNEYGIYKYGSYRISTDAVFVGAGLATFSALDATIRLTVLYHKVLTTMQFQGSFL
jgi:hypothetical protein